MEIEQSGLADASRKWYLKLKEELIKLGGKPTELDGGIFAWHKNNQLIGLTAVCVDDVIWGGSEEFLSVISRLKEVFKIGAEHSDSFNYLGTTVNQKEDYSITIDQNKYVNDLNLISTDDTDVTNKQKRLNEKETKALRSAIGQLNWLAVISRPEISFLVSHTSSRIKSATVNDIIETNRVIKFVKTTPNFISIPRLNINSLKIVTFSDAIYNNLGDGGSQGAHIIFLADDENNCSPMYWASNRIE